MIPVIEQIKMQIADKCVHFNGINNKSCDKGIEYASVRSEEKPYKFPCMKKYGMNTCSSCKFLTPEEVEAEALEIEERNSRFMKSVIRVKKHYEENKKLQGEVDCDCGGKITYSVAEHNQHMRASCDSCSIGFIE